MRPQDGGITAAGLCVFLGCTVACSSTETAADPATDFASEIDPDFELGREISLDLALLGFGLEIAQFQTCLVAGVLGDPESLVRDQQAIQNVFSGLEALDAAAFPFPEVTEEAKFMCEVLSEAVAEKEAVFRVVKETGAVPYGHYTFSTYESTSDDGKYEETPVGPFQDMEKCAALELSVRSAGFPTRQCQEWEPPLGGLLHELQQEGNLR